MNGKYLLVDGPQGIQRSPEWLIFRNGKISASMAPAIMNVDRHKTKLQLWESTVFSRTTEANSAMKRGTALESIALEKICKITEIDYQPAVIQSLVDHNFIASLDGYHKDEDDRVSMVEIKWPNRGIHSIALEGKVPDCYYPQLQHQLMITGADVMLYASCFSEDFSDMAFVWCERNIHYCSQLYAEESAFLSSLINFKAPEPCDEDWVEMSDFKASGMAAAYHTVCARIKILEEERECLREGLKSLMTHPRMKSGEVRIQKVIQRGRINYQNIPILKEMDLEKYRGEATETWRFTS